MKKSITFQLLIIFLISLLFACNPKEEKEQAKDIDTKTRQMVDSIGFATTASQMDSIIKRINNTQGELLQNAITNAGIDSNTTWKTCISPHDDYAYVGYLYPAVLNNIKAKTIIIFGVAHKAKQLGLEDKIIFDSYDYWQSPYGKIKVSPLRDSLMNMIQNTHYIINDTMQSIEHSVEAVLPFLQYNNPEIEIISILIPYMSYNTMTKIAMPLAFRIKQLIERNNLKWGKDIAFVISSDAVHYGDRGWGGTNYSFFGTDSVGYNKAITHEHRIIDKCLVGNLASEKIMKFINYTVLQSDYKQYIWTWCGRYSVPFGLLTTFYLQNQLGENLNGILVDYATSIDHNRLEVKDIGMSVTAPANSHHWVGYAGIGYE
ncbi:MAG: AmmeMemoRadiSam system protein B [Bacteroidales bacterium]|nr:AmmeMemoRadiSam system protein B [Bacteroidales bacterium]